MPADPTAETQLQTLLADVRVNTLRIDRTFEKRLIPSVAPKQKRHPLAL